MATPTVTVQLNEALEKIQGLEKDLAQNTAALSDNEKAIAAHVTDKATLTTKVEALTGELATATAKVTELSTSVATYMARITELEATAKTADQKAGEILGNVGAPAVTGLTQPLSSEELWKQYKAISDPKAKNAFYDANRQAMTPTALQSK